MLAVPSGSHARSHEIGLVVNTGLPQGKKNNCAIKDKYGFLWVGTTSGLYCFDGNCRPAFPGSQGLVPSTESNITVLMERGDSIWLGDFHGLKICDRTANNVHPFMVKTRYGVTISSEVRKIAEADNGKIWILTLGQGLFIYDVAENTLEQNSSKGIFYSDMAVGKDGRIYAGCIDGTINVFNTSGKWIETLMLPQFSNDKKSLKMVSSDDNLWISANNSLYRYNFDSRRIEQVNVSKEYEHINALLLSSDSTLLLATDAGVWNYDAETSQSIPMNMVGRGVTKLNDLNIVDLHPADDGSIIVVSRVGGVSHIHWKPRNFKKLPIGEWSDEDERITRMELSADGNGVWVGTTSGLSYFDIPTRTLRRNVLKREEPFAVTDIIVSGQEVWLGTQNNGLIIWNPSDDKITNYRYTDNAPYSILSNSIIMLSKNSDDEYYMLTDRGICKFTPSQQTFVTLGEIDNHIPYNIIKKDGDGRQWLISEDKSIYMRQPSEARFRHFDSHMLRNSIVELVDVGEDGNLYVITHDNEIFVYNNEKEDFKIIDVVLPKDTQITMMENDLNGNLWLGWGAGLIRVDSRQRLSFFSYLTNLNQASYTMSICLLPEGDMLFGFNEQLWLFDPGKIESHHPAVKAYVQSISFPYIEDNTNELERLGLNTHLYAVKEIKIPYSDNTFVLSLAAIRNSDMPEVKFDYMLEGIDKGWRRNASFEAIYTNVPPGDYTFLLRPNYGADIETVRLHITVLPPWYRTWWAYTIYSVLALLTIVFFVVIFRRRIREHYHRKMESERIRQEKEVYESKMKFFVDLVHEIRTPLTLISLPLEQLSGRINRSKESFPDDSKKHISSMRKNLDYLLGITNQLLDFRKAEKDTEIKLSEGVREVGSFIKEIYGRFDHPMEAAGKEIELVLPPDPMKASFDAGKLDRVLMNLIGNAIKYSKHKVSVTLSRISDGEFSITVADDGPGVPEGERTRIFDRYYQVGNDATATSLGTGLGLAYAKLIAQAHGGNIRVEENESGGATFILTLPFNLPMVSETDSEMSKTDNAMPGEGNPNNGKLSILVIDDNKELLSMMKEMLAERYDIQTAECAQAALDILDNRNDFDFIISDFMMPGMSGAELCRKVKNDVRFSHIPFIILTAKTNVEAKEEGMECGADVYIEKPFTIKQLSLQLSNMIHAREIFYSRMQSGQVSPQESIAEAPYINKVDEEFLESLNNYIQENIRDEEFSIDDLASKMNMSRSSFYRKLKAVTGLAPNDYLKNFRIDHAARLLLEGLRVTEAAIRSGFTSPSYFAKCFKSRFGVSPKEYVNSKTEK